MPTPCRKSLETSCPVHTSGRGFPTLYVFCPLEQDVKFSFFSMSAPIIGGGFPQLLPSRQGLWSSAILVKPLFNIPLKISSSTNSRYSLVQYGKYREYAKWGEGCLLLPLFWSLFPMPTLYFWQQPHHTIESKLFIK